MMVETPLTKGVSLSAIVIVTKNQYILANKIHHVTLNESYEFHEYRNNKGRLVGDKAFYYQISVIYTPDVTVQNGRNDNSECIVTLRGKVDAYRVYRDLINQIREQCPDQLFLNKALESLLSDDELTKIENDELNDNNRYTLSQMEVKSDRRPKRVRKARKAKRRNKKVLRKSKRRN